MFIQPTEEILEKNMALIKDIASKYHDPTGVLAFDDLVSAGIIGMIDAINKYTPSKNVKFSTYATIRVRGAILDEIRRLSPLSKENMAAVNKYMKATDVLQKKLGREPEKNELIEYLSITGKEIDIIEKNLNTLSITSIDSLLCVEDINFKSIVESEETSLEGTVIKNIESEMMKNAIDRLKEKEKIVLNLYYYENLTLKEIGYVLDVSESRVSQIHSKALMSLGNKLKECRF